MCAASYPPGKLGLFAGKGSFQPLCLAKNFRGSAGGNASLAPWGSRAAVLLDELQSSRFQVRDVGQRLHFGVELLEALEQRRLFVGWQAAFRFDEPLLVLLSEMGVHQVGVGTHQRHEMALVLLGPTPCLTGRMA